ncbi:glycosyltransferase family 2 protein [Haloarchaeobius sp. DFWS5]|uniref:glycosyltransferase family 2 protein n=1 Tax=Haloarchaeobius sp. DFWS5 TaxID=3446114 RepID=UPI003EBEF6C5
MPKVSVVIPTYNRADSVTRAIDSVLTQTVDDVECIVVDDASTDDTQAVLEQYEDEQRVRTLLHEVNQGGNAARNTGLDAAEGEYVALLDSDDEWKPRKLERQLERLENEDEDWVAAYCDWEYQLGDASGSVKRRIADLLATLDDGDYPTEGGKEVLVEEILADRLHTGAGSTLIVKTDVAREVDGFDEELDRFQDTEFALRVVMAGKLAHVREPLMIRHDTGSPSADTYKEANEHLLSKYGETVERLEAEGADIRGQRRLFVTKHYLSEGRPVQSLTHLATATFGPRDFPGLLAAAARGASQRKRGTAVTLGALALGTVVLAYTVTRGRGENRA